MKQKLLIFLMASISCLGQEWTQIGANIGGFAEEGYLSPYLSANSSGDIIAVGSFNFENKGKVRVYQFNGESWNQLGEDIPGENEGGYFGFNLSLNDDGNVLAVGSFNNNEAGANAGQVRIFEYNGTSWVQIGQNINGSEGSYLGYNVSLNGEGNIVLVSSTAASLVQTYQRDGNVWVQMGQNIYGGQSQQFGYSADINTQGNIIAVGSYADGQIPVRTYQYNGSEWVSSGEIISSVSNDYFGSSVSLNSQGSIVAVGAVFSGQNGMFSGSAGVYQFNDGSWEQMGSTFYGSGMFNALGNVSLNASGNIVAIGAQNLAGNALGQTKVYEYGDGIWTQLGGNINGQSSGDGSGFQLNLNSNATIVAIGALNTGNVRVFRRNVAPESIIVNTIDGQDAEIYVGETLQLESTVLPEETTNQDVVWSVVSGSEFASVNENGLVTGLSSGIAVIRAASVENSDIYGEIEVTVLQQIESIVVSINDSTPAEFCADLESLQLEALIFPENAVNQEVVWSVETGSEYVTIDENGLVTVIEAGVAEIRAASVEFPDIYGEIVLTINALPVLEIEEYEIVICTGSTASLYAASPGNVIFWYANEDDTEYLYHGNLFVTAELTENTTYWAEAYNISTGCRSEREEVNVIVNPIPDVPQAISVQYFEEGATLADLEVEAPGDLTWYADEYLTVELPENTLLTTGTTYYVTQTIGGCQSEAVSILAELVLGIAESDGSSFSIYPNPANGLVKIKSKDAVVDITVFALNGQMITGVKASSEVDLSRYPSGTYLLRVTLEDGKVFTRKVIKK